MFFSKVTKRESDLLLLQSFCRVWIYFNFFIYSTQFFLFLVILSGMFFCFVFAWIRENSLNGLKKIYYYYYMEDFFILYYIIYYYIILLLNVMESVFF